MSSAHTPDVPDSHATGAHGADTHATDTHGAAAPSRRESLSGWIGLLARLVLGGVLLWSGLAKITALDTSAQAVRAYKILPYEAANLVGHLLPVVEIAVGALLVLGLFTRLAALAGALLMAVFVAGIASVWARGISIDCGCFGGGGALDPETAMARYPWEIARDLALMACGLYLVARPRTPFGIDRLLFGAPTTSSAGDNRA